MSLNFNLRRAICLILTNLIVFSPAAALRAEEVVGNIAGESTAPVTRPPQPNGTKPQQNCFPDVTNEELGKFSGALSDHLARLRQIPGITPAEYSRLAHKKIAELTISSGNPNIQRALMSVILEAQVAKEAENTQIIIDRVRQDKSINDKFTELDNAIKDWDAISKRIGRFWWEKVSDNPEEEKEINKRAAPLTWTLRESEVLSQAFDRVAKLQLEVTRELQEYLRKHPEGFGLTVGDSPEATQARQRESNKLTARIRAASFSNQHKAAYRSQVKAFDITERNAMIGDAARGIALVAILTGWGAVLAGPAGANLGRTLGGGAIANSTAGFLNQTGWGLLFTAGSVGVKEVARAAVAASSGTSFICELANRFNEKALPGLLTTIGTYSLMAGGMGTIAASYKVVAIAVPGYWAAMNAIGATTSGLTAKKCYGDLKAQQAKLEQQLTPENMLSTLQESQRLSEHCFNQMLNMGFGIFFLGLTLPNVAISKNMDPRYFQQNRETLLNAFKVLTLGLQKVDPSIIP